MRDLDAGRTQYGHDYPSDHHHHPSVATRLRGLVRPGPVLLKLNATRTSGRHTNCPQLRGSKFDRRIGDIALVIQTKSGITFGLIVWAAVVVIALLTAFAFVCVAGHDWLSLQLGATFASLAMTGMFLLFALIGAAVCAVSRRRTQERAILARAARAKGLTFRLLDPKILGVAMQAGHNRYNALPVVGFLGAQLARETRRRSDDQ